MYVTEQLPEMRVQDVAGIKEPEALEENVTIPEGVTAVPASVSITVAVQAVGAFTGTDAGAQATEVEVDRLVAVREKLPELVL